ncbi:uncharacterized protein LOC113156321 isoform X2 [Anabas testudineus]|uniref:uncharacterized protein LOC113156321 isoform X2 n=1 Tax=Anabas testudineus TaxID=64144 RepID=UPI000E453F05|nr:uncharacterized protein LOC113156321 isoform X2 [Anabas testudineus]
MENMDKDSLIVQALESQSTGSDTDVGPEPEQEQQDESQPDTELESQQEPAETPEPRSDPRPLGLIEFRIQQLHNRLLILQKMQDLRKKAEENSSETAVTSEDSDEGCELEEIQKELEELRVKKEELERQGESFSVTANGDQQKALSTLYKSETPQGGIYMLPPASLEQRVKTTSAAETAGGQIIPVEKLGKESVVTRCPSCEQIISTEIQPKVSEAMWLLCCLFSMMGCVAGCCLIPFFMDSMKKVDHQCPFCQTNIYTYQPL